MAEPPPEHLLAPPAPVQAPTRAPEHVPEIPPYVEISSGRTSGMQPFTPKHDPPVRMGRGLWACGALILAAGLAGFAYLMFHFRADTAAASHVPLPGTGLVVDKPAGWTLQDLGEAPDLVGLFLDDRGSAAQGLVFHRGDTSILVVHVPNATGMQSIPELPDTLGELAVEAQQVATHPLGSGRTLVVQGEAGGAHVASETTLLLVADRIVVVGVLAPRDLTSVELATARAVTASLRRT